MFPLVLCSVESLIFSFIKELEEEEMMKFFTGLLIGAMDMGTTLSSCYMVDRPGTPQGGGNAVDIQNNSFNPAILNVTKGTEVTWTHRGSITHNVTPVSGIPNTSSGSMNSGDTFKVTFAAAGDWDYQCTLHSGMTGKIHVTE